MYCCTIQEKMVQLFFFEFEKADDQIKIVSEKHYRLVDAGDLSKEELEKYNNRLN